MRQAEAMRRANQGCQWCCEWRAAACLLGDAATTLRRTAAVGMLGGQ